MVLRIVHTVFTLIELVWRIFPHLILNNILTFRNRRRSLSVAAFRRSTVTVFFLHALHAHAKHGRFVIWTPFIWCEMGSRTCCSKWSTVDDDDADDGNDCKCDASSSSLLPLDVDVAIGDKTAIVKKFVPQLSLVIVSWRFINPINSRRSQQITGHFLSLPNKFATCLIVTNWYRSFTKCNLLRLLWLLVIDLQRNLFLFDTTEMCTNFVIITQTHTNTQAIQWYFPTVCFLVSYFTMSDCLQSIGACISQLWRALFLNHFQITSHSIKIIYFTIKHKRSIFQHMNNTFHLKYRNNVDENWLEIFFVSVFWNINQSGSHGCPLWIFFILWFFVAEKFGFQLHRGTVKWRDEANR